MKSKLENYKPKSTADGCILIHKIQGRLLLTDSNGLYHDLILRLLEVTEGNTLIILVFDEEQQQNTPMNVSFTANEMNNFLTPFYQNFLYDSELIDTLANKGSQPSVKILAKNFLVG